MVSPYLNRPIRTLDQVLQARRKSIGQPREAPPPRPLEILARPQWATLNPAGPAPRAADVAAADLRAA